MAEVKSVHHYDDIFVRFDNLFSGQLLYPTYDPKNIRFECLKAVIDNF